ncbi:MAG: sigma-70 family RNA polymerase sigma factor [Candidatus Levybacteria bacterium]|nr:sigma-70 family RNA polymerase sigma factor [Candidatus Levybacteria bacterium]
MTSIIDAIIQGDKKAIRTFYLAYSPKILSYLQRRLPRNEDAQEIMQDVFLDALDSLPLIRNTNSVLPYLYRIAHNKSVDFYRKKKIKSLLFSQFPLLESIRNEVHEPEFIYEKQKIHERIEKAFNVLSEKYQIVLRLHYEEGLKVKEIAEKLRLSFKATESLLFRARQQFIKAYSLSL